MTDKPGNRRIAVIVLVLGLVLAMGLLIAMCGVGFWLIARQQARVAAEREATEAQLMQAQLALESHQKQQASQQVVATPLTEDPRPLEYRTISLNGDKGGMLAVVDGQPRLVNSRSAWTEWTLRETEKGWTIQGRLSSEKPEPRFLGVDAEGKVTLVAEPGDGAYWKLTRKGDRMTSFDATIQTLRSKFDGWYLDFSDEPEPIEKDRFKYDSYRLTLSEKPGPKTNLHIFIDGP